MENMSDLDRKYLKKLLLAFLVAFIPSEIITHIIAHFWTGPYIDLFNAMIVPGTLLLAAFYIAGKYNKEREEMLGL